MDRYNTNILCTYHLIKDEEESDICYKVQYLDIFNLKNYDEKVINDIMMNLENKYKDNKYIKNLIDKKTIKEKQFSHLFSNDLEFTMCFQYEKFYIIHYILCKLINNEDIDEKKLDLMIENIK